MELSLNLQKIVSLAEKGEFVAAKNCCQQLIKKYPNNDNGYALQAMCCANLKLWLDAEKAARRAILLGNNQFTLIQTLGTSLIHLDKLDEAQKIIEELFNRTGEISLFHDIALIQQRKGNHDDASQVLAKLIELVPDKLETRYYKSLIDILLGRFETGWEGYKYRFCVPVNQSNNPVWIAKKWQGESLANKSVLVWFEQGMGDQLIMASCLNELQKLVNNCTVICDSRLRRIFAESFPQINIPQTAVEFETVNQNATRFDFEMLGGDLFEIFRKNNTSLLAKAYLRIPQNKMASVTKKLSSDKKLNVGISWFGGDKKNTNNRWSIRLKELKMLFSNSEINWVNLQFGEFETDRLMIKRKYKTELCHFPEHAASGDFYEYGQLISALDLVISVDNAAAVFSAALGKEVWVLTPPDPFWCWTLGGNNPWFENVRYFNRVYNQNWQTVIDNVCQALTKKLKTNKKITS